MFTFKISLAVHLSVALLLSEKKLQVEADECYSNSNCRSNYYCCKRYSRQSGVCRYGGCVDQSCSLNSDCGGPGECCSLTNNCTKACAECLSNSDCAGYKNTYCCKQGNYWQNNVCGNGGCVGRSCSSNSDCGGPGECCSLTNYCTKACAECLSNSDCAGYNTYCCKQGNYWQRFVCGNGGCVGRSCYSNSDCGGPGECCLNNVCTKSGCLDDVAKALAVWVIPVIVVSVFVAILIPIAIIVCCYCDVASASHGPRREGGLVITRPSDPPFVTLQNTQTVENNPAQSQSSSYPPRAYLNKGSNVPI